MPDHAPEISVVIPAHNASATIRRLLGQLSEQLLSRERYEVIVVDDGSDDDTSMRASEFPGVMVIRQTCCGPGAARNRGASAAKGGLILFLDADVEVTADLLSAHLRHHKAHPEVAATGGSVLPGQDAGVFSWSMVDHLSSWFNAHPQVTHDGPVEYSPSLNFCVSRSAMQSHGLVWDNGREHTGEDVVFCHRLRRRGLRIVFLPEAVVKHADRRRFLDYMHHMYCWGYHAPFVRGRLHGLRYGFLFPPRLRWQLLTLPAVMVGSTMIVWTSWLRHRPLTVTLSLPQIFLGRGLAYGWGVVRGRIAADGEERSRR